MRAEPAAEGWALFDLHQTIVPWDLQVLFCNFVLQREGWLRILLLPFFALLPFAKLLGSEVMKHTFMGFARKMERHRREGLTLILVSASPENYVSPLGRKLGFEHVFGTVVEVGNRLAWFPRFPMGNNKSSNKVVRLREKLGL